MIYIFNGLDMVSDDIYNSWLRHASTQRRDQVSRYKFHKDKLLCLASYRLLCYALCTEPVDFSYGKYGKPVLQNGGMNFNLTHCDGLVGCVVSNFPAGIDAEALTAYPKNIVDRVFTKHEIAQITASNNPDQMFYTLWTLKESYVKALGLGLQFPLHDVEFTLATDSILCSDKSFSFESQLLGNHIVSCCSRETHQTFVVGLEKLL